MVCTGRACRPVSIPLSQSTVRFAVRGAVGPGGGGNWDFCANYGDECRCKGLARIGAIGGHTWSLPLSVPELGDDIETVLCVQESFPPISIHLGLVCQCSRDAILVREVNARELDREV